jgi:hypothetical protein
MEGLALLVVKGEVGRPLTLRCCATGRTHGPMLPYPAHSSPPQQPC